MREAVDPKAIHREAEDLAGLRAVLSQLVGQPFRFFRVSYGDEVRLHLGDLRKPSRGRSRATGSHVLGVRASSWTIRSAPTATLFVSEDAAGSDSAVHLDDARELERLDVVTPGAVVAAATADEAARGFSLRLAFSDSSTFVISPGADDSPDDDGEDAAPLADWELLTPHSRLLRVGPGARWSHLDS